MKKITLATVKSFIKKNKDNLYLKEESYFSGYDDMVVSNRDQYFKKAEFTEKSNQYNLGIVGAWFVGGSRNTFKEYSDCTFSGIQCHSCCGSFILAKKNAYCA